MSNEKHDHNWTSCKHCGKMTPMLGTKLCDNCWELDRRIGSNLELAKNILAFKMRESVDEAIAATDAE